MTNRAFAARADRWVVKIGSSLVTNQGRGLDHPAIAEWCAGIARLRAAGRLVVLVSSGAVAEGMARLGLSARPEDVATLQATAAVGQMGLVRAWEDGFAAHGLRAAQVLLTHDDIADRTRYLNARNALNRLLAMGVVPVVNENDTVSTDEIRLGDNDTLGALTANLLDAELLVILTDQEGLFDADPRQHPDARLVPEADLDDPRLPGMVGTTKGSLGRGGMKTKLSAAGVAARGGAVTVIAHGRRAGVLDAILAAEPVGTLFHRKTAGAMAARKRWIAGHLQAAGRLWLDAGAVAALSSQGKSLLPVGVTRVEGVFHRGDVVLCLGPDGGEVARGLANHNSTDTARVAGLASRAAIERLDPGAEAELIHRDNLVLTGSA